MKQEIAKAILTHLLNNAEENGYSEPVPSEWVAELEWEVLKDEPDTPTIVYMHGLADKEAHIKVFVEWFLEVWQMVPPAYDDAYFECEKSLIHALNEVARSVGITRAIRHWSKNTGD